MRTTMVSELIQNTDAIVLARMELLLIELASTQRAPTDSERTFLEENVPLMRQVAEDITNAAQETPPRVADARGDKDTGPAVRADAERAGVLRDRAGDEEDTGVGLERRDG